MTLFCVLRNATSSLAMLCMIAGCTKSAPPLEAAGSAEPSSAVTLAQQLYPNMALGQGFDSSPSAEMNGPTGQTCVMPFSVSVHDERARRGRWFAAYSKADLEAKLSSTLADKIPAEELITTLSMNLAELYYTEGDERYVIGFMVELDTVRRLLSFNSRGMGDPANDFIGSTHCHDSDETKIETAEDFFAICGDKYLKAEKLGGYVLLTADLSNTSEEFRLNVEAALDISSTADDPNASSSIVDGDISTFLNLGAEAQQVTFTINALGISSPSASLLGPNNQFSLSDWGAYMNELESGVATAIMNGEKGRHPAYGTVIEQDFLEYTSAEFLDCSAEGDGYELVARQYACYSDFWLEIEATYGTPQHDPYTYLDYARDQAQWKVDNPDRVRWGRVDEDILLYEAALETYEQCEELLQDSIEGCLDARQGAVDALCDNCVMPEGCTEVEMTALFNGLPNAPILPPPAYQTPDPNETERGYEYQAPETFTAQDQYAMYPLNSHLCVWSGVSGAFRGGGEEARVRHSVGGYWEIKTRSQRSEPAEDPKAEAICTPLTNFFDTGNSEFIDEPLAEFTVNGAALDESLTANGPAMFALAGISGQLEGGGERFTITQEQLIASDLVGRSQQGFLRSWVLPFGMHEPRDNQPRFFDAKYVTKDAHAERAETKLERVDTSLCYLTEIKGKFNTGADRAWIEERDNYWWLVVQSGCEKERFIGKKCKEWRYIGAAARCYYYNQRL